MLIETYETTFTDFKVLMGNGYQASWQASVRISEGADNRGPDNRESTVVCFL